MDALPTRRAAPASATVHENGFARNIPSLLSLLADSLKFAGRGEGILPAASAERCNELVTIPIGPTGQHGVVGRISNPSGREDRTDWKSVLQPRARGQRGAVEVDVSPAAVAALPDACLLKADGERPVLGVEALV